MSHVPDYLPLFINTNKTFIEQYDIISSFLSKQKHKVRMNHELSELSRLGDSLDLQTQSDQIDTFRHLIQQPDPLPRLLAAFPDPDVLARHSLHAYQQHLITSEQLSTLLRLYTLACSFPSYKLIPIQDDVHRFLPTTFINECERRYFMDLLCEKPATEHYLYEISLPKTDNERINGLLRLADTYGLIEWQRTTGSNEEADIVRGFFAGGRDAFLSTRFGEYNKKKALPMVGVLSINTMNDAIMAGARPIAEAYPGVIGPSSFHGIAANPLLLSLHDEVHLALMSSIPNRIFHALLHAITVVRERTGIRWSKEIWDALDMDRYDFAMQSHAQRNDHSPEATSKQFLLALDARVDSEARPSGLFCAIALNETMWLLMIDLHCNQAFWQQQSIIPALFPDDSSYKFYYQHVAKHASDLQGKNAAEQVTLLISRWFELPEQPESIRLPVRFIKNRYTHNFLQIERPVRPLVLSKVTVLAIKDNYALSAALQRFHDMDFLRDPAQFRKAVQDVSDVIRLKDRLHPEEWPTLFHAIRSHLLQSAESTRRLLHSVSGIARIAALFPDERCELFQIVASHCMDKMTNVSDYRSLINTFPEHAEQITSTYRKQTGASGSRFFSGKRSCADLGLLLSQTQSSDGASSSTAFNPSWPDNP